MVIPENTDYKQILDNLTNYFKNLNKELYSVLSFKKNEFEFSHIEQNQVKTVALIEFDNRKELLFKAADAIQELRPTNFLEVQLPKDKDYNQDLKNFIKSQSEDQSLGL